MWDSLPVDLRHIEKTFIQNFHGVESKIENFHSKLGNYQIVPPIVHSSVYQYMMDSSESDGIQITPGGIDTVYADTSDFYFHFLQDLLTISNLNQEPNITISGSGNTINKLANLFSQTHPHIKTGCLERQDFLQNYIMPVKFWQTLGIQKCHNLFINNSKERQRVINMINILKLKFTIYFLNRLSIISTSSIIFYILLRNIDTKSTDAKDRDCAPIFHFYREG
ncbi:hypothetical protein BDD26_3673 [Xenorhabdus cabanillasii]|uniref:Uncharacterized protein n=1 Tax=Xenorhabdus cabanillasii TaxID=351673 RepID=A0A3D9UPY0_9GAMM|nr:hypothetical protein [Xenorhabdus cabanillasii]REF28715.1 hypothetical protein BDD26_3673 [Xenorhabdus cabanillasii]